MSNQISIPGNFTFHEWVGDLNNTLPSFVIPVPPKDAKHWKTWVYNFIECNTDSGSILPDAYSFPKEQDWKKWAYLFSSDMNTS